MPPAVDWDAFFLPAIQAFLSSKNPYDVFGFYNPPWVLVVLAPFSVLPYDIGRALLIMCAVVSLALASRSLGASLVGTLAAILSPIAFNVLAWGNVEWIALLGLAFPPSLGIILLSVKPQMTFGVILFLLIETWRTRGAKQVFFAIAPTAMLFALSFALYGFYPLKWTHYDIEAGMNFSFYPYTIPVGICLMIQAIRARKIGYALAASPCFFATLSPQVWVVAFVALSGDALLLGAATLSAWGVVLMSKTGIGV